MGSKFYDVLLLNDNEGTVQRCTNKLFTRNFDAQKDKIFSTLRPDLCLNQSVTYKTKLILKLPYGYIDMDLIDRWITKIPKANIYRVCVVTS